MFIYVLLMKLLIIGVFSGKVLEWFRKGFGEVSASFGKGFGRFSGGVRKGFGKVAGRFRGCFFGEVSGRFREGFGEVPICPAIENVKKEVWFLGN